MRRFRFVLVLLAVSAVILGGIGAMAGGAKASGPVTVRTMPAEATGRLPASAAHESRSHASDGALDAQPCSGSNCGGHMASQSHCLGAAGTCMVALLPAAPDDAHVPDAAGIGAFSRTAAVTGRNPAAEPPPPRP